MLNIEEIKKLKRGDKLMHTAYFPEGLTFYYGVVHFINDNLILINDEITPSNVNSSTTYYIDYFNSQGVYNHKGIKYSMNLDLTGMERKYSYGSN